MKKYDAFVSHSSLDKVFARKISEALISKDAKIWFDEWIMKPGDRLRDKINEGIVSSNYFIVVLSKNSVRSEWVRNELDSAMINEIEKKKVHVIPILLDKETKKNIPPDIKGKLYVDFSEYEEFDEKINKLLDVLNAEKRERNEFLKELRNGFPEKHFIISIVLLEQALRENARDQTIQNAAITGLSKYKSVNSYELIFQRMLDTFGMSTIKHCIKACTKIEVSYAILMLISSLWLDLRFFWEKLELIHSALNNSDLKDEAIFLSAVIKKHSPKDIRITFPGDDRKKLLYRDIFEEFSSSNIEYIKTAIIVSASTDSEQFSHGIVMENFISEKEIEQAWKVFHKAFPKIYKIVKMYNKLPFTSDLLNGVVFIEEGFIFKSYELYSDSNKEPLLIDETLFRV